MVFAAAGWGATFGGPDGVRLSFDLANVLSNPTQITFIYNMFALFIIFILAIAASQRDTKFMGLLIPLWAGFCMYAGWLKYPDQGVGFGILVVCVMLAIMTYMQETVHERFGIAGPVLMLSFGCW